MGKDQSGVGDDRREAPDRLDGDDSSTGPSGHDSGARRGARPGQGIDSDAIDSQYPAEGQRAVVGPTLGSSETPPSGSGDSTKSGIASLRGLARARAPGHGVAKDAIECQYDADGIWGPAEMSSLVAAVDPSGA